MTDLGIPIPRVKPNGVFCAGCGETGTHADTCPSLAPMTAHVLTDAGARAVEQLVAEVADLRARVATLEAQKLDRKGPRRVNQPPIQPGTRK
jgi:hypothetical protein